MDYSAANRAFLSHFDAELLQELQVDKHETIQLVRSKSGEPTLLFRGKSVHSRLDPEREARRLTKGEAASLHIHFGFGLGYFLQAETEDHPILVIEPNPAIFLASLREIDLQSVIAGRQVRFCIGLTRFRELLSQLWVPVGKVKWVVSPFHGRAYPQVLYKLKTIVQERYQRDLNAQRTKTEMLPIITRSSLRSVVYSALAPGIEKLSRRFSNKPAILIAPGPSLIDALPFLRAVQHRVLLITGVRSARILAHAGIKPHFLIHNEARPYLELLDGVTNLDKTFAVLADQCHVSMYRLFSRRTFVYRHPLNPVTTWLDRTLNRESQTALATGGSVATEAFSLALHLGCNPITLVGQDLCLIAGRRYAGRDDVSGVKTREERGVWGNKVMVPQDYASFVYWFRDTALRLRKSAPDLRLFNASSGVFLPGFEHISLNHLRGQLCQREDLGFDYSLKDLIPRPVVSDSDELFEILQQSMESCHCVASLCSEASSTEAGDRIVQLEAELFSMRQALPFLDGFAYPVLMDKPDEVRAYFDTFHDAAVSSRLLLEQALAEPHTANALGDVNRPES
jgi:hypothetical protein